MAPALLFALALFAADPTVDTAGAGSPAATLSPGEPQNDYQLVAWCYGALAAHMSLHDEAMPEVERIEKTFETHPGAAKEELAFYTQQQKEGKKQLALFREAMTAAEKASIKPIQQDGAAAMAQGKAIWAAASYTDKRRLAQEWMSWALPDRCSATAQSLEKKASVLGAAISYNAEHEQPAAAEEPAAPAVDEPAAAAPDAAAPAEEEPAAVAPDAAAPADAPAAEEAPAPTIDSVIDGDDAPAADDDQDSPAP